MTYKLWIGTGSRDYRTPVPIRKVFFELLQKYEPAEYYHGNAKGFDQYSEFILRRQGFTNIKSFDANWLELGNDAGMIRNRQMLDTGLTFYNASDILVIAMPLDTSIGTYGCMNEARKRGIDILEFDKEGNLVK